MPASRSRKPSDKSPQPATRKRTYWALIPIGLVAALVVLAGALPPTLITRLLPPAVRADDFSGNVWHGAAGKITVYGRDAGALEWQLHPADLLHLQLGVDLRWVKSALSLSASASIDRAGFAAHGITGGGPIEDLPELDT